MLKPRFRKTRSSLHLLAVLGLSACKLSDDGVSKRPVVQVDRPDSGEKREPRPDAAAAAGPAPVDGAPETAPDLAPAADSGLDLPASPEDGAAAPVDAGAPEAAPSGRPARCDSPLSLPVAFRRLPSAPPSDDIDFDRDGHFVSFADRSVVRMARDGRVEILARDLIGSRGGALRALPGGELFIADFERDALLVLPPSGQARRLPTPVDNPMKMVRGPAAGLYITGKQGAITRVEEADGAATIVATTPFEVGGLTFSHDYRTLYVGGISNNTIQAFEVRSDLSGLGPPRLWRAQIPKAQALAADECGSIYVVSEGDTRIRRIKEGGAVEVLAQLDNIYLWSLAFGSGQQGWSATAIYAHEAASGRLFEIPLAVAGQGPPPIRIE